MAPMATCTPTWTAWSPIRRRRPISWPTLDRWTRRLVGGRLLDAYRARRLVSRRRAARDLVLRLAATQFARLDTDGTGFIASLESGYRYALPQLGPGFVLEPQGQILWQKVSFHHDYDGLGDVALGDTTGPSGRVGLRGKWTIVTGGGQGWQPYHRANVWRDWGRRRQHRLFRDGRRAAGEPGHPAGAWRRRDGKDQRERLVFANVDYEFAVGGSGERETKRRSRRIRREIYVVI